MKKIGHEVMYVSFDFGSFAYIGVDIYEGKTIEECLKIRSANIDGYLKREKGEYKFIKI